jgi:hypothetical protein
MTTKTPFQRFVSAYIEAALWSTSGDDDEPLDSRYDNDDLADATLDAIHRDCLKFYSQAKPLLTEEHYVQSRDSRYSIEEMAGHDFWLTRSGHGAGFWDGDWSDEADAVLTYVSKCFGEACWYVGDDGLIYQAGDEP